MKSIDKFIELVLPFIIGIFVGAALENSRINKQRSPLEKNIAIDSLVKTNDSIKLKIETLDSIKNAKVIEVSTLDNDSTIKLFYQLVKE